MISVVMAVCARETAENLSRAIQSIFEQTFSSFELILVKDGNLPEDLEQVVEAYKRAYPTKFKVLGYETNKGVAYAWNLGLSECTNELVARMDSDDFARPERFKLQYEYLQKHPNVDLLGGYIHEFEMQNGTIDYKTIRKVPLLHDEIVDTLKRRNALNHVTVMFRKKAVEKVGGYHQIDNHVDYFLWVRMALSGAIFANLDINLVDVGVSGGQIGRRGGIKYFMSEIKFQRNIVQLGYISVFQMIKNLSIRVPFRIAPLWLRKIMYKTIR